MRGELARSTGCTDSGVVALATARAADILRPLPDRTKTSDFHGWSPYRIEVVVSPNVYKNGVSVGIPGTSERGLVMSAALGAIIGRWEDGLAVLDHVDQTALEGARAMVSAGKVSVRYEECPDPLYVRVRISGDEASAYAVIAGDYSNFIEFGRDGLVLFSSPLTPVSTVGNALEGKNLETMFDIIDIMDTEDLEFLLEAAEINRKAALASLADPSLRLGRLYNARSADLPQPFSAMHKAQVLTAAASEARMAGLPVPIMAIAGSGNHGITLTLGLLAVAETLGSTKRQLAISLARGTLVTIIIKSHVHRMTAFCGCAVAASTGLAAGAVYLLGGGYPESDRAMQTVMGTLAGILCDGAKESCAYKLSSSAPLAIQAAFAAMEGVSISPSMGILGSTAELSFARLGELNDPGMRGTEALVMRFIGDNVR